MYILSFDSNCHVHNAGIAHKPTSTNLKDHKCFRSPMLINVCVWKSWIYSDTDSGCHRSRSRHDPGVFLHTNSDLEDLRARPGKSAWNQSLRRSSAAPLSFKNRSPHDGLTRQNRVLKNTICLLLISVDVAEKYMCNILQWRSQYNYMELYFD